MTVGHLIDLHLVVKRIPLDMEIPGLQTALTKITSDYEMQIELLANSQRIASHDLFALFEQRLQTATSSVFVADDQKCDACR